MHSWRYATATKPVKENPRPQPMPAMDPHDRATPTPDPGGVLAMTPYLPGFYDLDVETGRAVVSGEYALMLGYEPEQFDLTPERWMELVHPDDRPPVDAVFRACIEGRQESYEIEYRMRTRHGDWRWIASVGRVAGRDSTGHARRLVGTHLDIARRREEVETLRRAQAVLDNMRDGAFWVGAQANLIYCNKAACRALGYTLEELLALRIFDFDPNFPAETWDRHWMQSLERGSHVFETQHRHKDGSLIPVEIAITPMEFGGEVVHCAFARDVSDRHRAQAALRESEMRFRTLFETMAQGVVYQSADGTITRANPAAQRILGLSLDQMQGRTSMDPGWHTLREDGSDLPGSEHPAMLALRSGEASDGVMGVFNPGEGSHRWIQVHATPQFPPEGDRPEAVVTTFEDISARRQAEDKLRHITRQDQEALHIARMGHWELDLASGAFTFNDQYLSLHGLTAQTAGGYRMSAEEFARRYVHPDDAHLVSEHIRQATETTDPGFEIRTEARLLRADGEARNMSVWFRIEKDAQGRTVRLYGVNQDITERKAAEEELRTLNATLEARVNAELARNREKDHLLIQQSRLAAMGEMIGNIAHQWRQPINALSLLLSNLKDAQEFGELSPDYLIAQVNRGHGLIEGMSSTIDDFRNFFRPNREPQAFRLAAAVRGALAIVESAFAHHHIDMEVAVLRDATLLGFSNEYSQVLLNLLANAKEAIEARNVVPGRVRIEVDSDEHRARVVVQDNGGGIPAEVLPKIFDPYFTTRDQGTGIGLYMSKMIIESGMRGRIEVANAGDGARISIVTPVSPFAPATQDD